MSDIIPTQHESAVLVVRERAELLAADIQAQQRNLEIANARHEELLGPDLPCSAANLRARAACRACSVEPANVTPEESAPRPSVFAAPSGEAEAA